MTADGWLEIERGGLPRKLFELWSAEHSGVVTVASAHGERELLFLRRGMWILPPGPEPSTRGARRLAELCAWQSALHVDSSTESHPPLRSPSVFDLGDWARTQIEATGVTGEAARHGAALSDFLLRRCGPGRLPERDEIDRVLFAALERPVSLSRLRSFTGGDTGRATALVYFLARLDRLETIDCRAERRRARATLGVRSDDISEIRSAYHTFARTLHPDLRGGVEPARRRELETQLAQVNRAYQLLLT